MRLFVAAQLPVELVDALAETSASLRSCVSGRFVGPDLFHVTLAFLGEVPAMQVTEVASLVRISCDGMPPFSTTLGALGSFGRRSQAVLWQGFSAGQDEWAELARRVRAGLDEGGFAYDGKGFLPHVTLMRRANVAHGTLPVPCVERGVVDTVVLYASDLSGPRPRYEPIECVKLQQDG
ncbi:MAG: RNA 2',3'-cyclic phosphodiesterase [Coriobacteriales bacterium]|nr:RNA 2',3'-cyclic phosphodiesterase [Coriobacteriales bacterium]